MFVWTNGVVIVWLVFVCLWESAMFNLLAVLPMLYWLVGFDRGSFGVKAYCSSSIVHKIFPSIWCILSTISACGFFTVVWMHLIPKLFTAFWKSSPRNSLPLSKIHSIGHGYLHIHMFSKRLARGKFVVGDFDPFDPWCSRVQHGHRSKCLYTFLYTYSVQTNEVHILFSNIQPLLLVDIHT